MKALRWLAVASALIASIAIADDRVAANLRAALAKVDPKVEVTSVEASPIAGLYAAVVGGQRGYVSADGRYFITGDMFEVASQRNLSEERRSVERRKLVATIDAQSEIIFAPSQPAYTITVFTDVDCPYCRKMHSEIADYNALGIAVRYVAFPRNGPNTPSWKTMEDVWCSQDRREAFTNAKRGIAPAKTSWCTAPDVARQFEVARKIGVRGTPTVVLESGEMFDGYLAPRQLLARIKAAKRAS